MAAARDRELAAFVDARGGSLLRLAYLLTGDADRAKRMLLEALGDAHRHWAQARAGDLDATVRSSVVHAAVRRPRRGRVPVAPAPEATDPVAEHPRGAGAAARPHEWLWAGLAALTPRQRAVLVLRESEDLDDEQVAELVGTTVSHVAADRAAVLRGLTVASTPVPSASAPALAVDRDEAVAPGSLTATGRSSSTARVRAGEGAAAAESTGTVPVERLLREVLADPPGAPRVPDDLTLRVLGAARTRRRRRRRWLAGVTVLALLVAAAVVVVPRLGDDPADDAAVVAPPPPAATDPRLVGWVPRGPLAGDTAFLDEVAAVWRDAPGGAPLQGSEVSVLWAGEVGAGRVALVQTVSSQGEALVAQLADHDGRLTLDRVEPLAPEDPAAFVLDYDGDIDLSNTVLGPGAALLALVMAPDDGEIALYRRSREVSDGLPGAGFIQVELGADGLSESWLHLVQQERSGTVVAVVRSDGPLAGRISTISARPTQLAAAVPRVSLAVDPWGPGPNGDLGGHDDAIVAAGPGAPRAPTTAAVLWSGRVGEYRAAVLRTQDSEGAAVELIVRRRSVSICHSRAPAPVTLGTSLLVSCSGPTGDYTVLVGATPDTRVSLVDASTGVEVASGVGATWLRTETGAPAPVVASGS